MLLTLPACGKKTDEANRAAGITPPNALALVSVNLSPSIEQKANLLTIARLFPGARDKVKGEFDSARDDLLGQVLKDSGLDFKADVQPWLGKEAAVAVLPPGDADSPLFVAMVQTNDKAKATAAIAKAAKAGTFKGAYGLVDDFVIISDQPNKADNQAAIDLITAQAKKTDGGLAKSASFTNVVDQLHGDRLVLGWVDVKASIGVADNLAALGPASAFVKSFSKDAGTIAFDLHAESKAVVFQGVATTTGTGEGSTATLTRSLPATALAALTLFDLGKSVTKGLTAISGVAGSDVTSQFEQATGLSLQDDILSWMHGEAVVVAGAVPTGQPYPNFALVVEPTDKAKAAAAVTKIKDKLAGIGFNLEERKIGETTAYVVPQPFLPGIQPAMALFPDRFVLANSPAFLGDLAKSATPGLGDSAAYKAVLGSDDKGTTSQFVVLIDPIREAIEKAVYSSDPSGKAAYEKDVKPNLEPLSAFGFKSLRDGAFNRIEVRLTFD